MAPSALIRKTSERRQYPWPTEQPVLALPAARICFALVQGAV